MFHPPPGPPPPDHGAPMYAPPPGAPPGVSTGYAPPPGPPPASSNPPPSHADTAPAPARDPTPPPSYGALQADPPAYETYNFQAAYQRWCDQAYETQRQSGQRPPAPTEPLPLYASRAAPTWYGVPFLRLHPTANGGISFHLTGADDGCTCPPARPECTCGQRHPPLWVAHKSTRGGAVELFRAATQEEGDRLALSASRPGVLKGMLGGKKKEGEPLGVKDGKGKKADVELRWERASGALVYGDPEGSKLTWQRIPASNEHWRLVSPSTSAPLATYQGTRYAEAGGVVSLDAFAWSRLMSEHIYCDFPRCQTRDGPLFGFRFRCETCTEQGEDSFDVCEACLYDACSTHDATHRFVRIPRPGCEPDDDVREVPLLRYPDLMRARLCIEGVLLGCAVLLLGQ